MAVLSLQKRFLPDNHILIRKPIMKGLISHGAIKPNERPIWFDVYEAFPPAVKPTYGRPAPEDKPIRQIFYEEDLIRAKFHSRGYGIHSNLFQPLGETVTKKLIEKYKLLQNEDITEDEIIEKCVAILSESKDLDITKTTEKIESKFNFKQDKESSNAVLNKSLFSLKDEDKNDLSADLEKTNTILNDQMHKHNILKENEKPKD